ncbi:LysR substrate-binding domain-containing protein [Microbacterium sp. NPDC055357]
MAKGAKARGNGRKPAPKSKRAASASRESRAQVAPARPVSTGPFRLGMIPGATPGTWVDRWIERMPHEPIDLVPLAVADQRAALIAGEVDAALVRLPIDRDGLHVIALYDEVPVVVSSSESHLTAADELTLADLAGEVVITPLDDVLRVTVPDAVTPAFETPATTEDAIATVAAGVGVLVVPMSLARLHQRKDAASRPLRDGPASTVALAWVADRTTPSVETFVGIVRGRTANSSRS